MRRFVSDRSEVLNSGSLTVGDAESLGFDNSPLRGDDSSSSDAPPSDDLATFKRLPMRGPLIEVESSPSGKSSAESRSADGEGSG